MGVQSLWQILAGMRGGSHVVTFARSDIALADILHTRLKSAAAGTEIDPAMLQGKTLAIDTSIWLYQFIKAMRNENGEMLPNAHLVGMFRRVLKLLFWRVRPVFVFDGAGMVPSDARVVSAGVEKFLNLQIPRSSALLEGTNDCATTCIGTTEQVIGIASSAKAGC
jgi:hypothetical protein